MRNCFISTLNSKENKLKRPNFHSSNLRLHPPIGHTPEQPEQQECPASGTPRFGRGNSQNSNRNFERRLDEINVLYAHESSRRTFGLSLEHQIGDENSSCMFRERQLFSLVEKIKAKQQIRVYYTNLLASVTFFSLYATVICLQKVNIPEQSMVLQSFLHTIISDLPADSQGYYSSGLGTAGYLSSQQDLINWLNYSIIQRIFTDEKCGDGVCSPSEYKRVGRFGCESDCGLHPNQTEITVNLNTFVRSRPVLHTNKWDLSHTAPAADPDFRFNIFSESMHAYIFAEDLKAGEDAMVSVLDGVYRVELYQTSLVSPVIPKEDFFRNSFILAHTVPPRTAKTDFSYGDYREFLAVSASIVDAAVDHCFGPDPPLTSGGLPDTECDHFFQQSFFVRAFSGYGLSGQVKIRNGNQAAVSLVDIPYCGIFPNGSLGLGGMRRYYRGVDVGQEWVDTGSEWNIPIIQSAGVSCGDDLDISGVVNLYRSMRVEEQETTSRKLPVAADEPLVQPHARHDGGVRRLLASVGVASELQVVVNGPAAREGGPGYSDGLFWLEVEIKVPVGAEQQGFDLDIWYSLENTSLGCKEGTAYSGPFFVSGGAPDSTRIRANWCNGSVAISSVEKTLPVLVDGPSLHTNLLISGTEFVGIQASQEAFYLSLCVAINIASFCSERVELKWNQTSNSVAISMLAESNVQAAAWRKSLVSNVSLLQQALAATGISIPAHLQLGDVSVKVPVPDRLLRSIQQPCTSHYDCVGEVTGTKLVNGSEVDEYGWGRAFCALWGSPLTDGVGPTCDSCRLYCTNAQLSSIDGICPENCGAPWSGQIPACLSAQVLKNTYQCSNSYQFEVRSHSQPNDTVPDPRQTEFARLRTLSGFNSILGAVVITQQRIQRVSCLSGGNEQLSAFTQAHGVNCSGPDQKDGKPYGVDPAFSKYSSLYSGKHIATEYYNGELRVDTKTAKGQFSEDLEGFTGPDGFVPYGFYPHRWDTAERQRKNQSQILANSEDEFKLFFDVRIGGDQADLLLTFLQDGRFIDELTHSIQVELVTYNADVNMFASIRFSFQMQDAGGISWDYSIRMVDAVIYSDAARTVLEAIVILCLAISMMAESIDIFHSFLNLKMIDYFMSPFNWLDLIGFVIQSLAWSKWYALKAGIGRINIKNKGSYFVLSDPYSKIRPCRTDAAEEYQLLLLIDEISRLADLQVEYSTLTGIIVVQLIFKVMKSLHFQPRMGLITRTIARAGSNLVHFMALFILIFFGYALVGHLMFGPNLTAMSSLPRAMRTLGYMLISFDSTQFHSQMTHAVQRDSDGGASYAYEVYVWTYIFLNIFILLNILLAILVAGYTDIAGSSDGGKSIVEDLFEYFEYNLKRALLPVESFISDEQLVDFITEEIQVLRDSNGVEGNLQFKARASAQELAVKPAILLGGGISMEARQTKALVKKLLDSYLNSKTSNSVLNKPKDQSFASTNANIGSINTLKRLGASLFKRAHREESSRQLNHLVIDLMSRYGEDLDEKSCEISADMHRLLELENHGRLVHVDARTERLEALVTELTHKRKSSGWLSDRKLAKFDDFGKKSCGASSACLSVSHSDLPLKQICSRESSHSWGRRRRASDGCVICTTEPNDEGSYLYQNTNHSCPKGILAKIIVSNDDKEIDPPAILTNEVKIEHQISIDASPLPAAAAFELQVVVMGARQLPRMDFLHSCDPYCILFMLHGNGAMSQHQVTRTLCGLNPIWEERFAFQVELGADWRLVVAVWDKDRYSADDLVGSADIDIDDMRPGIAEDDWYELRNKKQGRKLAGAAICVRTILHRVASDGSRNSKVEWAASSTASFEQQSEVGDFTQIVE